MLKFSVGLTDFRRIRISPSSRFLVVSDGNMLTGKRQNEGYEVWTIPPGNRATDTRSSTLFRHAEWEPLDDVFYIWNEVGASKVSATEGFLQEFPDTVATMPEPELYLGFMLEAMAFSPDGQRLVTLSPFEVICSRRTDSGWQPDWQTERIDDPDESREGYESVAMFPEGKRIVLLVSRKRNVPSTSRNGESVPYTVWDRYFVQRDLATGDVLSERVLDEKEYPVGVRTRLAVTPDGKSILGFRGRSVRVWPTDAEGKARKVAVGRKDVWDVALHPSGRWFLVANGSDEVSVWNVDALKMVQSFDWGIGPVQCVDCSPDGNLAAAGSPTGRVAVWDWEV